MSLFRKLLVESWVPAAALGASFLASDLASAFFSAGAAFDSLEAAPPAAAAAGLAAAVSTSKNGLPTSTV